MNSAFKSFVMLKALIFLRAIILPWVLAIHTFFCSILVLTVLLLRTPRAVADFAIQQVWCATILFLSGIKVDVLGKENIPKEKGFLYLFTHSSHFDIPVMFANSPKSFRFGAKIELFKIPIFGHAVALAGTLPITRDDREKVIEVYREAEARVARGEAFALAPEGGRRVGKEIKPFKSGPFIFAMNAKMPIVPVVLCGVEDVMRKGSILINPDHLVRRVGMKILPAMDTSHLTKENIKEFRDQVRELVVREYEEMKKTYL